MLSLASRLEPIVDSHLLDTVRNLTLRLNPPQPREVVLDFDRPWEGDHSNFTTLLVTPEGKIRAYYRGDDQAHEPATHRGYCVAESDDGIHFTRPDLNICQFQGNGANNIIFLGGRVTHTFAPFVDNNPHCKIEERYKAVGFADGPTLAAYVSSDGLRWHKMQEEPVITQGKFDSHNVAFWDSLAGCYRCYARYLEGGIRAIQSCTSTDFLHWTDPLPNRYAADCPFEHFYTNATTPCPGAEHILFSFPMRFLPARHKLLDHDPAGVSDAVMLTSRDGVEWDRTFRGAWIRPGRDQRNWTQRSNIPAWGIIPTAGAEFSFYLGEHNKWPDNRLRRYSIPRHRFASVHANVAGGQFTTPPLTFTGRQLQLNYATSAAGALRVEIQTPEGTPLPGFSLRDCNELYGDVLEEAVTWRGGDLSALQGAPIRLHFTLHDADLYALQFTG